MAKMQFTTGGSSFTPHPKGQFEGVIEEVFLMDEQTFVNSKTGEKTNSYPRQFVIRNTDGHAEYSYQDRETGEDITGLCTVRSRPLYFYSNGEGGFFKPTGKSNLYQYYTNVMGEVPDFNDFDDECVLGIRVMYSVLHVDAEDKDDPDKVFANLTGAPMRHPDQSGNYDIISQEQRASDNTEEDYKPEEGSAGAAESLKDECVIWIAYLHKEGVWAKSQCDSYNKFLNSTKADITEMTRFCEKAKADCEQADVALPGSHPDSTGNDDLPF